MPTSDVYDVLIHFVRRDGLRDKDSGRKAFYNLDTRAAVLTKGDG